MQNKYRQIKSQLRSYYSSRCPSSSMTARDFALDITIPQFSEELEQFNKQLKKMIRKYLPEFSLKSREPSLELIANKLDSAIERIYHNTLEKNQEETNKTNEFIRTTTQNLSKYEKLLEKKAKELERQIKMWDTTKELEEKCLEKEKEEVKRLKNHLETEIKSEKDFIIEKTNLNSRMIHDIKILENIIIKENLEKKSIQWNIDQNLRNIEEKELILQVKEKMIEEEKLNLRRQSLELENERMNNKSMIEKSLKANICWKCQNENELSSENIKKSLTSMSVSSPESNFCEDMSRIRNDDDLAYIVKMKASLENSKFELDSIKDSILPELNTYYQILITFIDEVRELKENTEEAVNNFNIKFDLFQKKIDEINNLAELFQNQLAELIEKEKEIDIDRQEFQIEEKKLNERSEKINQESQDFYKEKLELFNEISEERKKIEEYYNQIEEKLKKINSSEQQLMKKHQSLKIKENQLNLI